MNKIGMAVRSRRKALGLTLQQVVDRMGIEFDTGGLSRAERGLQGFSPKSLEAVARALETTEAELYADTLPARAATAPPAEKPAADYDVATLSRELQENWSTDELRRLVDRLSMILPREDQLDLAAILIELAKRSAR